MYEMLTAFIPALEEGSFGSCSVKGRGTPEDPLVYRNVEYSRPVRELMDALFAFRDAHEEMRLDYYTEIADEIIAVCRSAGREAMDVSALDGRLIVGMLLFMISMTRFSEGAFIGFCRSGTVLRCLKRLQETDEAAP